MRTTILLIASLLLCRQANAQIAAGEVPAGQAVHHPAEVITLTGNFTADSLAVEFDCDDGFDAWVILRRGAPELDAPNSADLRTFGNEIEVCMDTTNGIAHRPRYYTFGQPLDCSGAYDWQSGSTFTIGDFGGFGAIGPSEVDSLYIAFRQDGITSWMRLSFDLAGDPDITLQVHAVLSVCGGSTSIAQHQYGHMVSLSPNPSAGQPIRIECAKTIQRVELLDISGRVILELSGAINEIPAPEAAGTYLVRVTASDGWSTVLPLVCY